MKKNLLFLLGLSLLSTLSPLMAEEASSVTQYGITWTFDKPYPVGQFVTGDYWVLGPVNVVSVSPTPGPAADDEKVVKAKSRYGATSIKDDKRMRNGSMIIIGRTPQDPDFNFGQQGYDSRGISFEPASSIAFPHTLPVNQTLISTISSDHFGPDGKLATPFVLGDLPLKQCSKTMSTVMESAAVLTCLDKAPPADAFRPAYAGTVKTIYETKDIQWDLLLKLPAPASTPDWAVMERIFQRPWLDHIDNWAYQNNFPSQNQPGYGREFARMTSFASLMLLLDVPREKKEKLMIGMIQLGIDLSGLGKCGRTWFSEQGGHFIGRKWPILFASIMLNNEGLRTFPPLDLNRTIMGNYKLTPTPGVNVPTMLFGEDMDTYYGQGGDGQKVLAQITVHTGRRLPFEEKPRATLDAEDQRMNNYRVQNSTAWNGQTLAALLMKAKAMWNHDAYFDYNDRMMSPSEPDTDFPKWFPAGCTRSIDLFTQNMWDTYRKQVPDQPGGTENVKWVWNDDKVSGHLEANPKN